jgi:hypothetical protein
MERLEIQVNGKTYWYYQALERALTEHRKMIGRYVNPIVNLNINKIIMEIEIKGLRVQIDGLFELTGALNPVRIETKEIVGEGFFSWMNSPDTEKASEALKLGKAWLGKCLGAIGTASPYANDGNRHSVEDIEEAADKNKYPAPPDGGKDMNHIEKVDWLREQISIAITRGRAHIEEAADRDDYMETPLMWYWFESKKQLMVARFWLGFELERIRKADESMDTNKPMSELPKS